mgnify:CR=1 FL=1
MVSKSPGKSARACSARKRRKRWLLLRMMRKKSPSRREEWHWFVRRILMTKVLKMRRKFPTVILLRMISQSKVPTKLHASRQTSTFLATLFAKSMVRSIRKNPVQTTRSSRRPIRMPSALSSRRTGPWTEDQQLSMHPAPRRQKVEPSATSLLLASPLSLPFLFLLSESWCRAVQSDQSIRAHAPFHSQLEQWKEIRGQSWVSMVNDGRPCTKVLYHRLVIITCLPWWDLRTVEKHSS